MFGHVQGPRHAALRSRNDARGPRSTLLAVDSNLGWKCQDKYVATVPQVFDP